MIHVEHEFEVAEPVAEVWALLSDFDAFARCVPTLVEYTPTGPDRATGVVGVTLGAIPVRSRVEVEITERRPMACIKGRAISYLGETVAQQLREGRPGAVGEGDMGRIEIHLDLGPAESGGTRLVFRSDVHAEGKLVRIYQAILKLKAEGLKAEFEQNLRGALRARAAAAGAPVAESGPAARLSLGERLRAWLRRLWAALFGAREGAA